MEELGGHVLRDCEPRASDGRRQFGSIDHLRRANSLCHRRGSIGKTAAEPKVAQLHCAAGCEENVAGLDVTVYDGTVVGVDDGAAHALHDGQHEVKR